MSHPRTVCACQELSKLLAFDPSQVPARKTDAQSPRRLNDAACQSAVMQQWNCLYNRRACPSFHPVGVVVRGSPLVAMRTWIVDETDSLITWLVNFTFMFTKGFG